MSQPLQATIFNIQKFSLHDGPGIRTVVFFKGCPLRCRWCSNPESQNARIQILHDENKCAHCLSCVKTCDQNAISFSDKIHIDHNKCNACLKCLSVCKPRALSQEGKLKTIDEVIEVCLQDLDFYLESDGGVTLSGGEVLTHSRFASELLKRLQELNIHTAIETTGYAPLQAFKAVIDYTDLILFDVKHYDSQKHHEYTGVHNELIIENLKYAIDNGYNILGRLPVIPGFNDTLDDALGFVKLMQDIGLKQIQLLPFHQFGENKYAKLGLKYLYEDVKAYHESDLADYLQVFLNHGIEAFF